jgi:hypothetical protein
MKLDETLWIMQENGHQSEPRDDRIFIKKADLSGLFFYHSELKVESNCLSNRNPLLANFYCLINNSNQLSLNVHFRMRGGEVNF